MCSTFLLYPLGQRVHGRGQQSSGSLIQVGLERNPSSSSRSVNQWALCLTGNSSCHLLLLARSLWVVGAFPHMFKMFIKHAFESVEYILGQGQVGGGRPIILGLRTILRWGRTMYLWSMCWAWLTQTISLSVDSARHESKGRRGGTMQDLSDVSPPFLWVTWCISTKQCFHFFDTLLIV